MENSSITEVLTMTVHDRQSGERFFRPPITVGRLKQELNSLPDDLPLVIYFNMPRFKTNVSGPLLVDTMTLDKLDVGRYLTLRFEPLVDQSKQQR